MYKVSTEVYKTLLERCYNVKSPLYVYGGPGIGKSEIPRQLFSELAKTVGTHKEKGKKVAGKIFVEWTDLTVDEKMKCIENPDDYFVFCDQRVGQMDSTDLRGIPNLVNTEMLETVPMSWVIYFTKKDAHGVIFFDELNLAAPVVAGQAYQIINDRAIADRRLGDDVFVFGAGNRQIDEAHVFVMPFPLRDRFNEVEIEPAKKAWTEWAGGKVNSHLIAFVNWKESYLYKPAKNSSDKGSTPRGIVRASKLIDNTDITSDITHQYVSIAVGEAFATEFQAYVKHFQSLNWNTIYSKPDTVDNFEVDKLWAIIGGMAEQYSHDIDQKQFEKMMEVTNHLPADFAIVNLRMLKDTNVKKFINQIKKCKNFTTMVGKFGKFLIN